jgi:hypothetical protein
VHMRPRSYARRASIQMHFGFLLLGGKTVDDRHAAGEWSRTRRYYQRSALPGGRAVTSPSDGDVNGGQSWQTD